MLDKGAIILEAEEVSFGTVSRYVSGSLVN